ELEDSIDRARRAIKKQTDRVERLRTDKSALDKRLVSELRDYDSAFVAEVRELDRQVATLTERLKGLKRMKALPEAIEQLLRQADESRAEEEHIRRAMDTERAGLTTAGEVINEIESAYLEALLKVGVPGVSDKDSVQINRQTWIPSILEGGDEEQTWNFFDTG